MLKFIAAAAAFTLLASSANAEPVRLATEGAYAPWNFLDDSGNPAGFDVDVGNEVCHRAGLECVFITNEWDSIIPNLLAGNYDAIVAGMSITDERLQTIDFSEPYSPAEASSFMTLAGTTIDFDSLKGVKIGVQGATIQAAYVDEHYKDGNTVLSFESADQALADLSAGNVDVILADHGYIGETVAGSGGALQQAGPRIPIGGGVGIGLRKADDELEGKVNAAIASMKADGSLDGLITKWFPEKGEGPFFPG